MDDGAVGVGDCAAVQYSGAGGRDPLFLAHEYIPQVTADIIPVLEGYHIESFRSAVEFFDTLEIHGKRLHTAIRYGLSQALLAAIASSQHVLPVELICKEYQLPIILEPVPLFGQSGDDRYDAVDKMIIKGVDALPHGLINTVEGKLGRKGELLSEYISWIVKRIDNLRKGYTPDIHIDVYGTIGLIFDHNMDKIAEYLAGLEKFAYPHKLYIEGPVDMGSREPQIEGLAAITRKLANLSSGVNIVADEWCNTYEDIVAFTNAKACHMVQIKTPDLGSIHRTIESVLYCKEHAMEAYQGGTCNETDVSARMCVHAALATRPERMLVKPGMGFDEGYVIVKNEMQRTLTQLRNR